MLCVSKFSHKLQLNSNELLQQIKHELIETNIIISYLK